MRDLIGGRLRAAVGLLLLLALAFATAPPAAHAQGFPFCAPGQPPRFQFGFAALKAQLGDTMGQPVECEHADADSGDTLQHTTTGLAFYRRATNTPTFTDGWQHWGLTAAGLVYWEGASIDPPVLAAAPATAVAAAPPPAPRTLQSFVDGVVGQIDDYWKQRFAQDGRRYTSPRRVMWVTGATAQTACSSGRVRGPGYCTMDRTLILPARFFEEFWPEPDAAIVVVISHEWGHHVQNLLGLLRGQYFNIQTELQADCLAGNFFQHAGTQGWLDPGDVEEAAQMSFSAGDNADWRDPRAHGSPQQRMRAFMAGYEGRPSCWDLTP